MGLGTTTAWGQWYASPKEIYVWRAPLVGMELAHPDDANLLLAAYGRAKFGLDAKGIVVGWYHSGEQGVDIVMTADRLVGPRIPPITATGLAEAILGDPEVHHRLPALRFGPARLLQLTGPPSAIDFWRQHPTVYDDAVGPTDAWSKLAGVYLGEADDGVALKPWVEGNALDPSQHDKPTESGKTPWLTYGALGLGAAAVAWLGAHLVSGKARTARRAA